MEKLNRKLEKSAENIKKGLKFVRENYKTGRKATLDNIETKIPVLGPILSRKIFELDSGSKLEMSTLFLSVVLSLPLTTSLVLPFGESINNNNLNNKAKEKMDLLQKADYGFFKDGENGIEGVWALFEEDIKKLEIPKESIFLGFINASKQLDEMTLNEVLSTAQRRNYKWLNPYLWDIQIVNAKENVGVVDANGIFSSKNTTTFDKLIVANPKTLEAALSTDDNIDSIVAVNFEDAAFLRENYSEFFNNDDKTVGQSRKYIVAAVIPALGREIPKVQIEAIKSFIVTQDGSKISTDFITPDVSVNGLPVGTTFLTASFNDIKSIAYQSTNR